MSTRTYRCPACGEQGDVYAVSTHIANAQKEILTAGIHAHVKPELVETQPLSPSASDASRMTQSYQPAQPLSPSASDASAMVRESQTVTQPLSPSASDASAMLREAGQPVPVSTSQETTSKTAPNATTTQATSTVDKRTREEREADFYKALTDAKTAAANGNPKPLQDFDAFFKITRNPDEYKRAYYADYSHASLSADIEREVRDWFIHNDKNNDGMISKDEVSAWAWDKNKPYIGSDGKLSVAESFKYHVDRANSIEGKLANSGLPPALQKEILDWHMARDLNKDGAIQKNEVLPTAWNAQYAGVTEDGKITVEESINHHRRKLGMAPIDFTKQQSGDIGAVGTTPTKSEVTAIKTAATVKEPALRTAPTPLPTPVPAQPVGDSNEIEDSQGKTELNPINTGSQNDANTGNQGNVFDNGETETQQGIFSDTENNANSDDVNINGNPENQQDINGDTENNANSDNGNINQQSNNDSNGENLLDDKTDDRFWAGGSIEAAIEKHFGYELQRGGFIPVHEAQTELAEIGITLPGSVASDGKLTEQQLASFIRDEVSAGRVDFTPEGGLRAHGLENAATKPAGVNAEGGPLSDEAKELAVGNETASEAGNSPHEKSVKTGLLNVDHKEDKPNDSGNSNGGRNPIPLNPDVETEGSTLAEQTNAKNGKVYVAKGGSVTKMIQDIAAEDGKQLTGHEAWKIYETMKDDFSKMDNTYKMSNGHIGLSKPGEMRVDNHIVEKIKGYSGENASLAARIDTHKTGLRTLGNDSGPMGLAGNSQVRSSTSGSSGLPSIN